MVQSDLVPRDSSTVGRNCGLLLPALSNNKGSGSEEDEEKEGQIRVGREYQAVPPPYIPVEERRKEPCEERALLVWAPGSEEEEEKKVNDFLWMASDKYGYNSEQALGMLFWHKHDMDRAVQDMANYTPFNDELGFEDKVMFEQAFQFHGKSFQRIRQMLPDKSIAQLVKHYYSWKKTRSRPSTMDQFCHKLAEIREEGLYGEENFPTDSIKEKTEGETKPSKGLNYSKEDLTALMEGKDVLEDLNKEIASCMSKVQINKQIICDLHHKSREVDGNLYRLELEDDVISARWTEEELLLGVQGVRMHGNNFTAIASILGTKTAGQVETFFDTYKFKFDLDSVLKEWREKK